MANIYDMSDTWNDGATTFTSIKMNVTDTASASGSLLMDLQVGGTSQFSVTKNGAVFLNTSQKIQAADAGIYIGGSNLLTAHIRTNASRISIPSGSDIRWQTSIASVGTTDLILARDAANTLAQRNSTNAQTFNLYNTYTDASNYERGFMKWNSNVLEIGTEAAGTGSARSTRLVSASQMIISPASNVMFIPNGGGSQVYIVPNTGTVYGNAGLTLGNSNNALNLRPGSTNGVSIAGNFIEAGEMTAPSAPSTDKVRIYAEDNGSGKTRLMALFPTGAAQQIAIEP